MKQTSFFINACTYVIVKHKMKNVFSLSSAQSILAKGKKSKTDVVDDG